MILGTEWVIDAVGCNPAILTDLGKMRAVFDRVISDLDLHVQGEVVGINFRCQTESVVWRCCPNRILLVIPTRNFAQLRLIFIAVAIVTPGPGKKC